MPSKSPVTIALGFVLGCAATAAGATISTADAGASTVYECETITQTDVPVRERLSSDAYLARRLNERSAEGWRFLAFVPEEVVQVCFERAGS